jgi:hypothetical protein
MSKPSKLTNLKTKILTFLILLPFLSQGTVWRVDGMGDSSADFLSLQNAIDNVSAGDTLYVRPTWGDYGDVSVSKQLTIIGTGYFLLSNDSTQYFDESAKLESIVFSAGSEGSLLQGFEIIGAQAFTGPSGQTVRGGVVLDACCIHIDKCFLTGFQIEAGIGITWNGDNCKISRCLSFQGSLRFENNIPLSTPSPGIAGLMVSNSVFRDYLINNYEGFGSPVTASVTSSIIEQCIFIGNSSMDLDMEAVNTSFLNTIFLDSGDESLNATGSTFQNCLTLGSGLPSDGNNQINISFEQLFDPSLEDLPDQRFTLSENSPARNAAIDGGDLGIFGGSEPYVLSGMPDIPSIFELNVATQGEGSTQTLDVNLKAKSHD